MFERRFQLSVLAAFLAVPACQGPGEVAVLDPEAPRSEAELALPSGVTLTVERELELAEGVYLRPAPDGDSAVLLVEGRRDLELDLEGVTLLGAPAGSAPDAGAGIGLWIRDCQGVRVRGGNFGGYRVAVRVEDSDDVQLEGLVVEPAFGKRLVGTTTLPDPNDRLNIEVEGPERWAERYGAAILVVDSSRVEVRGCRTRGGQNGLLALGSEGCRFLENDFSYLSGWGIALAGCDQNLVAQNRCDSITRRGTGGRAEPDHGAAGILLTEGSSENRVYANSARRGSAGGRELFGGRASGRGNRWFFNDFSGAECVAFDLDRSQDCWFVGNRIDGSRGAGLRARGAEGLLAAHNRIERVHGAGISLEGGRRACLYDNDLVDCDLGLELLGSTAGDAAELDHWIGDNRFRENIQDLVLVDSVGIEIGGNDFESRSPRVHLDGLRGAGEAELGPGEVWAWMADHEGQRPSGRGVRSSLRRPDGLQPEVLERLGAAAPPAPYDRVPIPVARRDAADRTWLGDFGPWDPDGGAPRPRPARLRGLLAGVDWDATWFRWNTESDPRGDLERWRAGRFDPLTRAVVDVWSDPWGGSAETRRLVPERDFGLIASAHFEVERGGTYLLSEVSDDGVRIAIDGEVVLEDWSWHPERQRSREVELSPGRHRVVLEYFQIDGAAVLSLELREPPGS